MTISWFSGNTHRNSKSNSKFLKINRISTGFLFKYKKIAKLILKFFSNLFISKNFFYEIFFIKFFLAKIFFTTFSQISFVFDVCKIMYFPKFFIRNFAYCEFFSFAILVYEKKIVNFFRHFFFQRWTWIPNLKMFFFWKKVKFSLIVLLDFFIHY